MSVNLWADPEHALRYLRDRDKIPHRVDALGVVVELLPATVTRVLDLGTGDGSTLALVLAGRADATGVGVDFQAEMLRRARARFDGDRRVEIRHHDLERALPDDLTGFDLVVSSFAIHHVAPKRQRVLYGEVFDRLVPGGLFVNAEHVASRTESLHVAFLAAVGLTPEEDDPSNQLVPVPAHLAALDDLGFEDAECVWKWREIAVLAARRPGGI